MDSEYPAHGPCKLELLRIVASQAEAVTHVAVTDGIQRAEAISFFEVADGRTTKLVENWPVSYAAPPGRAHLTDPIVA
jgi:hypothetical protein